MLSKNKKSKIRNVIFRHLDGVAISTTLVSLDKNKIIDFFIKNKKFNTLELSNNFQFNIGYFNIALRLLCSQGLLNQTIEIDGKKINYTVTNRGLFIFKNIQKYYFSLNWYNFILKLDINKTENLDIEQIKTFHLKTINNLNTNKNDDPRSNEFYLSKQLNGIIISPIISILGFNNFLESNKSLKHFADKNQFNKILCHFLSIEGWLDNNYNFTKEGNYALNICSAYGVTISYLQTFLNVDNLLFHNPRILRINTNLKNEIHVNRKMNVWGSGGSHKTYFKFIDKIIIDIFNGPLENQPIGIADMGCGNGEFLEHVHSLILNTYRGKNLNKHPLHLIGADFNQDALEVTKKKLTSKKIKHHLLKADISNPDDYAKSLKNKFKLDLKDFLNIRSFLDHNRIFSYPINTKYHKSNSTCSFSYQGKWIPNYILENNLIEHFKKWKPYVKKYGIIILELHSISPELNAKNIGNSLSTPYDATHGFSDQFIIEIDRFQYCIKKSNLKIEKDQFKKFPNNELATVSINYIK